MDREKVIKGLHNAWNYLDTQRRTYESIIRGTHVTCFDDTLHAIDDALALLKAQEPRVMTIEEVTEDCPDVVWFDDRHFVRVFAALPKNENYHGWVKFIWRDGFERHDHIDGYGKTWRCWTSRPDERRRAETPWYVQN